MAEQKNINYDENQIQVLEGLEAVRKRPGMYIGSTSIRGLHHLIYEIVDNSIDEALAGWCDKIIVTLYPDNSVSVQDDGRGVPSQIHHKVKLPTMEVVFTVLHAGGKFGGEGYKIAGGLHGVGASVVNALSEWMEIDNCYEGERYTERFERGKVARPFAHVGSSEGKHGLYVRFKPDPTIFEETVFDYQTVLNRLREQAFLNAGVKIILRDERGASQAAKAAAAAQEAAEEKLRTEDEADAPDENAAAENALDSEDMAAKAQDSAADADEKPSPLIGKPEVELCSVGVITSFVDHLNMGR